MKFYIVDCFAEEKYQGNQLAVFLPEEALSDDEMQKIAREMHFSETSFILSGKQENGGYAVRIFTPDTEVPFAGHPTIGTAFIIWKVLAGEKSDRILLNLKAGTIPVDVEDGVFTMEQNQPEFGETVDRETVAQVLSIPEDRIRSDLPIQWVSTGLQAYIIPLVDEEAVKCCRVDHGAFARYHQTHDKCNMLVFCPIEKNLLKVRVFMDDTGFLEDPATGSANGCLAGYLLQREFFGEGAVSYTVLQGAEAKRPSKLYISGEKRSDGYTIRVGGKAFLAAEGVWR